MENNPVNKEQDNAAERLQQKKNYALVDFHPFQDKQFIHIIYRCLLRRNVDLQGEQYYLEQLRQSVMSKECIIAALCYSKEGQLTKVKVKGAKKYYYLNRLTALANKLPLLMGLPAAARLVEGLMKIPYLTEKFNQLDYVAYENENTARDLKAQQQELKTQQQELKARQLKFEHNQEQINLKQRHLKLDTGRLSESLQAVSQEVNRNNNYLLQQQNKISELITQLSAQPKKKARDARINILAELKQEQSHFLDLLYVAFEDRYRGTEEQIKQQVSIYLPYIESVYESESPILDIGCGRGEWLQLLQQHNYKAQGIDLNAVMVSQAKENQLQATCIDALDYLKQLPDNTLSAVTGIHIIEHLEFTYLIQLLQEVYRVLKIGGVAIFETPNPENLFVGAQFFYTDPTHRNPLVPNTVEFLMDYLGYTEIQIKRLHTYAEVSKVQGKPRDQSDDFKNNHFYNAMDFAVIAYKNR